MKKHRILSLLAALIILFAVVPAFAVTYKVPTDKPTIQQAIADANPLGGDTILVEPGAYTPPGGGYLVDKPLNIKGQTGADNTFLELNNSVFRITANDVVISGFTIRPPYGVNLSGSWTYGVFVGGTSFQNHVSTALTGVVISKCVIEFFPIGLCVLNADGAKIIGNTFRYAPFQSGIGGVGIFIVAYDRNPADGVTDFAIHNTLIQKNYIYDNGNQGIRIYKEDAAPTGDLQGTKIISNILYNNGSLDITLSPYNQNIGGIFLQNIQGTIEVTNNKFLQLSNGNDPIEANNVPGLDRSGNKTYTTLKGALTGGSVDIP